MREFMEVKKKISQSIADPRGTTITAFTVREVAAFTGLAQSTIYTYLSKQRASSCKMPGLGRKNARVVTQDVFVRIVRQTGNHRVLNKHMDKVADDIGALVDFMLDQLF